MRIARTYITSQATNHELKQRKCRFTSLKRDLRHDVVNNLRRLHAGEFLAQALEGDRELFMLHAQ